VQVTDERAQKNQTLILTRLQSVGQARLAEALNTSESTVSRWKAEQIEQCARALSALGLKVVPTEARCFDPKQIEAILQLAKLKMSEIEGADQLMWND
jgi:hypothetical protein